MKHDLELNKLGEKVSLPPRERELKPRLAARHGEVACRSPRGSVN